MENSGEQKMKIIGVKQIADSFVSQTPEKKSEKSLSVRRGRVSEIPEKYLVLSELFDSMVCSVRLLSLRKRSTTFHNIRIQVEILTGRNFQYRNLAQMKFILPEALKIKKVLVHDKKALCTKPEMYVTLEHDIVGSDHEQSVYVALSDLFTSRMRNFHKKHPEVSDIPEAKLPEPFNEKHTLIEEDLPNMGLSMPTEADLENSSHTWSSHKSVSEAEETTQDLLSYPSGPPYNVINLANKKLEDNISPSEAEETTQELISYPSGPPYNVINLANKKLEDNISPSEAEETTQELISYPSGPPYNIINLTNQKQEDNISPSPCFETDLTNSGKLEHCSSDVCASEIKKGTPLKLASECSEITLETPAQPTPKRSSSCQNKHTSVMNDGNINSLSAKRSLMFSHLEDEENVSDLIINEKAERIGSVQDGLLKAELNDDPLKNGTINVDVNDCATKESHQICQHDLAEHHQSTTCLSDIVPVINQIFKSVGWRSITKDELIHKILVNYFDIEEKGDAERHVELLENLVPYWIYKELTPSGDHLYSVKKISDLGSILATVSSSN